MTSRLGTNPLSKNKTPVVDPMVIQWLNELFPDRLPNAPVSPEEMGVLIGQQQVIRRMRSELQRQNKDNNTVTAGG